MSDYRRDYARQARFLCMLGASDDQLAEFFEISMVELALWAWNHKSFYTAITPTETDRLAWIAAKRAKRSGINARKRRYNNSSPSRRIMASTRARIWAALKGRTDGRLFSRLEYSADELVMHLQSRFQPGMDWDNYGKWHVDHIKPCSRFNLAEPAQFNECWALTNLQPLWAQDNIRKGAKYG